MKKKPSIPDAILAIDFGGLSTRVFCQSSQTGSKASSFVMESQVGPVSQDIANCFTKPNLASASPENIAWVAIGNECRAVGYLAAAQFNAHIGLAGLKYSSALYKALAALWVISRKLDLGNQFSAAIAVFLPPGEFNDSKQFFELLSQYSASFETPTGKLSVTLDKTQALQEGGGIALIHNSNLGSAFKQRVTAFVMVGFRNASVIVSARGAVGKGKTSDLGMVKLVDLVQERTSNYDASRLALSIAQTGVSYNRPYFYRIARNREDAAKDREVDQLIEAVKLSRFDYARMLSHWINEVLPPDLDEIVFCGGTSEYMKPELRNHFSHYLLSWHAGITVPKTLDPDGLGCRIADVYGLFSYFKSQFEALGQRSIAATSQRAEDTTSTSGDSPVHPTDIQSVKECVEQSTKPKSEEPTHPRSEPPTQLKIEQFTHAKSEQSTEQKTEDITEQKFEETTEQKFEEPTEQKTEDITELNTEQCAKQKADSSIKDSCLDDSNKLSDESNTEPSLEESEANLDADLLLGGPYRGSGKKVRNYA
ncbi:ParM/StbA family protein [Microcoleus sp. LEGE 07076]|uniref:ParM/StbA family protein n=1 Tax=Microcoleus sp. LEGE 07076 TaxID=915322 RepID=UPI001D1447B7|nr:ParM/StbA family protein [Microcoleus sp. LEGE 07076]